MRRESRPTTKKNEETRTDVNRGQDVCQRRAKPVSTHSAERSESRRNSDRRSSRTLTVINADPDLIAFPTACETILWICHVIKRVWKAEPSSWGLHRWAKVARWVVVSRGTLASVIGGSFDPQEITGNAMVGNGVDRHPLYAMLLSYHQGSFTQPYNGVQVALFYQVFFEARLNALAKERAVGQHNGCASIGLGMRTMSARKRSAVSRVWKCFGKLLSMPSSSLPPKGGLVSTTSTRSDCV